MTDQTPIDTQTATPAPAAVAAVPASPTMLAAVARKERDELEMLFGDGKAPTWLKVFNRLGLMGLAGLAAVGVMLAFIDA